jgi:hypothetical protein
MINTTDCKFKITSWFKTRLWLGFAISLLCSAASAQNYPVSGVWVAAVDRFPGSTAAACFMLKKVGINAVATQRFPRLMIFSEDRRFEVRRDYRIEKTARSIKNSADGSFRITEAASKRWLPWYGRRFFKLKIVDPITIEVTEGNVGTRFFKCSSSVAL